MVDEASIISKDETNQTWKSFRLKKEEEEEEEKKKKKKNNKLNLIFRGDMQKPKKSKKKKEIKKRKQISYIELNFQSGVGYHVEVED